MLGVRFIRIVALPDRLDYPGGVPLCILDLLLRFLVWRTPYVDEMKEGSGGVEGHGCVLRDLVRLDHSLGTVQRLLGELLDICLACRVVGDGVLRRIGTLCLYNRLVNSRFFSSMVPRARMTYLLQFVHQLRGVCEHLFAVRVQLLGQDLVDHPVFACSWLWSAKDLICVRWCIIRTPVRHYRLDSLELRSLGRAFVYVDIGLAQRRRYVVRHSYWMIR